MKRKPEIEILNKYCVYEKSDTVFSAWARLLQSYWRTKYDFSIGTKNNNVKLGSRLDLEKAKNNGLNFISKRVFEIVKNEVNNPEKVISEPRIWNNMLSSQPLCFNLFGELKYDIELSSKLFQKLFPEKIKKVCDINFEYSPSRGDSKYTADKSAFDVFIDILTVDNKKGFIGIEVKYAENLRDKPSSHKKEYDLIADKSKIFKKESYEKLKQKPIQQIWRDHLLSLSLYKVNNDYETGMFVYIYPEKNTQCKNAIDMYKKTFKDFESENNGFYPLTFEVIEEELKKLSKQKWIKTFFDRYFGFNELLDKINKSKNYNRFREMLLNTDIHSEIDIIKNAEKNGNQYSD